MVLWDEEEKPSVYLPQRKVRDRSADVQKQWQRRLETLMSIPFVGVDGEGGNVELPQMSLLGPNETSHEYLLLRAGDKVLETGKPLTWYECFEFLADLPQPANYVSYFFDYDVTMMVRQLTPDRLTRLLRRHMRTDKKSGKLLPLDVGPFQIDYLPGKEFKVRRNNGGWVVIQDVGTFFQTGFIKTLDKWQIGTPEERRMIGEGKALRSEFGELSDEVRFYNALECNALADLMTQFRDICKQLGYMPSRWEGPGLLATAAFKKHKIPRSKTLEVMDNGPLMNMARAAYYGGRFEIGTIGPTPAVEQWDINSAYPYCIQSLPCLVHGKWECSEERRRINSSSNLPDGLFLSKIVFDPADDSHYYGFPIRSKNGNIAFPASGVGWYWSPEIRSVVEAGYQNVELLHTWTYTTDCKCQPFNFIEGIYNARKRLGKDQKGWVLKLLLNSLYGKMAQSIGQPAYSNPIWAGLITSMTRSLILDAVYSAENTSDIHMIATDGIFATKGALNLPVSDKLGGWSKDLHDDGMFIIQAGLYFTETDIKTPKTRGVPQKVIVERRQDFLDAFKEVLRTGNGADGKVTVQLPTFLGAKACLHRDNLSMAGHWITEDRTVTFDWKSKRHGTTTENGCFQALPYVGSRDIETVPYNKLLGVSAEVALVEMIREELAGQPDWVPLTLI